ncbi:hypothetical protein GFV16_19785 [Bacillus megaterium]|uniref:hypothetical protein n=1 Tax=Priestia megaterium TaxID=1404 RepID=UPI00129390BD|nr:hypothetical protein [Priestia megaterium]MQR88122.1 hypothetical protein [Priestia megaterium]
MFGSVEYFTNQFRTCVMNNLIIENPRTLFTHYSYLIEEIIQRGENAEKEFFYLENIEKAYRFINEEIFGMEEKTDGN